MSTTVATNRIDQLFATTKKSILNIYFTAGYPNLEDTGVIIETLAAAGVDLIEIGMPYSDPLADGPTIQKSSQQALQNGMTLPILFEQIKAVRSQVDTPLIMMGYYNQVMQYGQQRFIDDCVDAGVDGLILPDLPLYEYQQDLATAMADAGIGISFLITPQTSDERIQALDDATRGFIYMVSNSAITGAKSGISEQQLAYFERIAAMDLRSPRLIGFGISSKDTFDTASRYSRGAIIGSAFIRAIGRPGDLINHIQQFVSSIRP